MTYPDAVQNMIDDFSFLEDWEDRYTHVIEMGKALPSLIDAERCDVNKVNGCVSQVWLVTKIEAEGKPDASSILRYRGDSDAHIVKGLVAIVIEIFSGQTAQQISAMNAPKILQDLGLSEHLSSQRSNGLVSMINRIQQDAQKLL